MKLLTLNTHSLLEESYEQKFVSFLEYVLLERPDVIALQEVNQTMTAPPADARMCVGMAPMPESAMPVRRDNYAAWLNFALRQAGVNCEWTWLGIKRGYGCYEEGLALLSLHAAIAETDVIQISKCRDPHNWKLRKALGVRLENGGDWFYSVHMGWWNDEEEPFHRQWAALNGAVAEKRKRGRVWLMGDFNSPAEIRGEGYDCMRDSGWQDAWLLAEKTRSGATVAGVIDGWRDQTKRSACAQGMRIDHIWCSDRAQVLRASVVFDGGDQPRVSDHFGVLVETESAMLRT